MSAPPIGHSRWSRYPTELAPFVWRQSGTRIVRVVADPTRWRFGKSGRAPCAWKLAETSWMRYALSAAYTCIDTMWLKVMMSGQRSKLRSISRAPPWRSLSEDPHIWVSSNRSIAAT